MSARSAGEGKDYERLRREHSILKRGLRKAHHEIQALTKKVYESSREKHDTSIAHGEELRHAEEEIDRLGFANEGLKRRIAEMMEKLRDQEEYNIEASGGSLIGTLLGSDQTAELQKMKAEMDVIREELKLKIEENECVHMKVWEQQQEFLESTKDMRRECAELKAQCVLLRKECASKERFIKDLADEKEVRLRSQAENERRFDQARTAMADRERDVFNAHKDLTAELETLYRRFSSRVLFDNLQSPVLAELDMPHHDHRLFEAFADSARQVISACGKLSEAFRQLSNSAIIANRLRTHHPDVPEKSKMTAHKLSEQTNASKEFCDALAKAHAKLASLFAQYSEFAEHPDTPSSKKHMALFAGADVLFKNVVHAITVYPLAYRAEWDAERNPEWDQMGDASSRKEEGDAAAELVAVANQVEGITKNSYGDLLDCISSLATATRRRATTVARRLDEEQRNPLTPGPLRTALKEQQSLEFKVATVFDRFAGNCQELATLMQSMPTANVWKEGCKHRFQERTLQYMSWARHQPPKTLVNTISASTLGPQENHTCNDEKVKGLRIALQAASSRLQAQESRMQTVTAALEAEASSRIKAEEKLVEVNATIRRERDENRVREQSLRETIKSLREEIAVARNQAKRDDHKTANVHGWDTLGLENVSQLHDDIDHADGKSQNARHTQLYRLVVDDDTSMLETLQNLRPSEPDWKREDELRAVHEEEMLGIMSKLKQIFAVSLPKTFSRAVSRGHGAKESVGADFFSFARQDNDYLHTLSEDERAMRLRLLDAALEHTDAHGWTVDALIEGAVAIGLSPQAHGIALRGPVELVEHAVHTMDREFAASAPEKVSEMLSMEEDPTLANALAVAAKLRMQLIVPRLERWPQAMALGAVPENVKDTAARISRTCESIIDVAEGALDGDAKLGNGVHMAGLAAIYSSTELYMLTDDSLDHWDSWNFLERQIEGTIGADESILDVAMTIGSGAMSMATAMASLGMQ
eukprot:g1760.t1